MRAVLENAVEGYRRQRFLERVNTGYAALRDNGPAWHEERAERALWDNTLGDGLPAEAGGAVPGSRMSQIKDVLRILMGL